MNNIDEMSAKCKSCPYWEACEYPYICQDTEPKPAENGNLNAEIAEKLRNRPANGDLISRQAAIDALTTYIYNVYKVVVGETLPAEDCRNAAESVLGELPTVQPKHGTWKRVSADKYRTSARYIYRCDKCGEDNWYDSDFCPCCGADMRTKETDCDYERAVEQL